MELNNENVLASLGQLTVMELIALTKELEAKWNIKAAPVVSNVQVQVVQEDKPTQTEFDVVFVSFASDKKMTIIKLVRELLAIGLMESKTLVESLPKTIKEGVAKEEADALATKLTEAGAVIEIK